jgi:hypothetical protein
MAQQTTLSFQLQDNLLHIWILINGQPVEAVLGSGAGGLVLDRAFGSSLGVRVGDRLEWSQADVHLKLGHSQRRRRWFFGVPLWDHGTITLDHPHQNSALIFRELQQSETLSSNSW